MYQIVLASKSPRRIALLKEIGLNFTIYETDFEELESLPGTKDDASRIALYNSLGKAKCAASHFKKAFVIGVDTVVDSHGHILGKPKNKEDAARLMRLISGTTHRVISAVTIINTTSGKTISQAEATNVTLEKLDEKEIKSYIESGEGSDKAGSYAIQGRGALFIKKIDGDYFNVVGLPLYLLRKLLKEFKVDLTKLIK